MKCHKCGRELSADAKFCIDCGARTAGGRPEVEPKKTSRFKWILAAVVLGILIIAGVAFTLHLRAGDNNVATTNIPVGPSKGVTMAPVIPGNGNLTAAPIKPSGAPVTGAQAVPNNVPPPDVVAYIEWIRKMEEARRERSQDFGIAFMMYQAANSVAFDIFDDTAQKSSEKMDNGYDEYIKSWDQMVQHLKTGRVPKGCEGLFNSFYYALATYESVIADIRDKLSKNDINGLYKMSRTAQPEIDTALLNADNNLAQVCNQFGIPKNFDISDKDIKGIAGF